MAYKLGRFGFQTQKVLKKKIIDFSTQSL